MIDKREEDGVTVLTIEHGKVNALDLELLEALNRSLEDASGPSTAALVLTGAGRSFSAGVDLFRLLDEGSGYLDRFYSALVQAIETLYSFDKPVVAAINGHAIAGGCILAQCCDYRIMAEGKARTGAPELLVGVPFPVLALEILRSSINPGAVDRVLLGGATLLPAEAMRAGLIDATAEPSILLDLAIEEAERLASISPPVYALTKRQLREPVLARVRRSEEDEREVRRFWENPETHIRIRDYLERTVGRHS